MGRPLGKRAPTRSVGREVFPLICPTCQAPLTFIAFASPYCPPPPLTHPARGPPQTELAMGPGGRVAETVAHDSFPDDLDQSPEFDPTEPEPIPEDDFDQSDGA